MVILSQRIPVEPAKATIGCPLFYLFQNSSIRCGGVAAARKAEDIRPVTSVLLNVVGEPH